MFAFPLGLQAKTRDFPFMTLAIFIATTVYSAIMFDSTDQQLRSILNNPTAIQRFQKQKALALAACPYSDLKVEDCALLKITLHPQTAEMPAQFLTRLFEERAKQTTVADKAQLRKIIDYAVKAGAWVKPSDEVRGLKEFNDYQEARALETTTQSELMRSQALLTRSSFNVHTLFRSLFLHVDWSHLLGNMIFFLLFAIPLEQRVGSLAVLLIYFLGGATGMTIELFMSSDSMRPILGASASVSAIAAAFMIAFWKSSVRVWVSLFFVYNQIVLVPTWLFFTMYFVIQDVTGAVAPTSDGVAHIAHLGGFGTGILLGAIASQMKYLSAPFVFPFELELFIRSRALKSVDDRFVLLREILFHNRTNSVALMESWRVVQAQPSLSWEELSKGAKVFLNERYCELLLHMKSADKKELLKAVVTARSAGWPIAKLVPVHELPRIMMLVHTLVGLKREDEALALARLVSEAYPNSDEAQALKFIERRIEKLAQQGQLNEPMAVSRTGS